MKLLSVEPYSQKEAERAAGMGSYIAPKQVRVMPQPSKESIQSPDVLGVMDGLSQL